MDVAHRVLFIGSKSLGLCVLRTMVALAPEAMVGVITIDDRADIRTQYERIADFAGTNQLPLSVAQSRQHAERLIQEAQPDLCLVAGWYWLISQETLDRTPRGFIGIHNSLLPKYRGSSPLVWTIINGERVAGFSLFSFTPGMDDGPIWATGTVAVDEHATIGDVLARLEEATEKVLHNSYLAILRGQVTPTEQDHSTATYCAPRLPDDGMVNWHHPAHAIYNFIRAQSEPYPGAYTWHEGQKVTIWKARPFAPAYYGTPGQVARISNEGVYVTCGDNRAIILEDIEMGGRRARAQELFRSVKTRFASDNTGR